MIGREPRDVATSRGVSTFVREVHADLDSDLRALFDLPRSLGMDWTVVGEDALDRVVVSVPQAGVTFELHPAGRGHGQIRGGSFDLRVRSGAGDVVSALARRFRALEPTRGASLLSRAQRSFRFRDVGDHAFRDLSPVPGGTRAMLRLGFGCNQDCGFCWQGRDWPEPPPYAAWLRELAAAGATHVVFSGGEPTLHPGLPDLIRLATLLGLSPSLQTNAIRLRTPRYLRSLREAGLDEVFVSLHAGDAALSDAMTRARGTFVRTLDGIDAALADGMVVDLNAVVERRNHDRLLEHAQLITARFASGPRRVRTVQYSQPSQYRDADLRELGVVPMSEVRPQLVAAARHLLSAGIAVVVNGTCGFPPCLFADEPDLVQVLAAGDFEGMDASSRHYAPTCTDCALRSGCLGVRREYLDAFGDDGLRPFGDVPEGARGPTQLRPTLRR